MLQAVKPSSAGNLFDFKRLFAVKVYLTEVLKGQIKTSASALAAGTVFSKDKTKGLVCRAACIRAWTEVFLETGELPTCLQGKHKKVISLRNRRRGYSAEGINIHARLEIG